MQIAGSTTVITGGASGLGRATAERLHAGGGHVVLLDLARSPGKEVAGGLGDRALFVPADVTSPDEVTAALEGAVARFGAVHVLVNCAGIGTADKTFGKRGPADLAGFARTIQINLIGTFNCIRLAAAQMAKNAPNGEGERGVIINTASIAAFEGQIGQVAYTAAKAGIAGMSLTMARDLGSMGIRVNTIAPSLFATGLTAGIPQEFEDKLTADAAFPKRMGRPDEYARLAVAIIENPMLNGGTIRLDGGQRFAPK
jgi:NAD(P)-dependent dehydrogenase (short-subunit alcohol dehydrogenase family)